MNASLMQKTLRDLRIGDALSAELREARRIAQALDVSGLNAAAKAAAGVDLSGLNAAAKAAAGVDLTGFDATARAAAGVLDPLREELARMEAVRLQMQPLPDFTRMLDAERLSIAAQAAAIRLPELHALEIARFSAIEEMRQATAVINDAFRPAQEATRLMAEEIARLTEPHRRFSQDMAAWSASLDMRMTAIKAAWVVPDHLALSGLAFGQLAAFSDTARYDSPFAKPTNEIFVEALGVVVESVAEGIDDREAQYDEAGRAPGLVAFPASAFDGVIVASGFMLELPRPPTPQPIANFEPVSDDDIHYRVLKDLENHLRLFVSGRLAAVEPRWEKQRVPGYIFKRWKERQAEARDEGRPVFAPIYYSDLGDLGQIMIGGLNWPIFSPFFEGRDGLLESLRRLTPIRNAVAHGRPLGPSDVLFIVAEGLRLMRAIGVLTVN